MASLGKAVVPLLVCLLLLCSDDVSALTQPEADGIEISILNKVADIESSEATTVLRKADFERGTVIISEPGVYVLGEDVDFDPNASNDWLPDCNETSLGYQEKYCTPGRGPRAAYRLVCF